MREWLRHHARAGAGRAYLYTRIVNASAAPMPGAEWVALPEVRGSTPQARALRDPDRNLMQVWAYYDCMWRAAADGAQWAVFLDPDEFLSAAHGGAPTYADAISAAGADKDPTVGSVTFASVVYHAQWCRDGAGGGAEARRYR